MIRSVFVTITFLLIYIVAFGQKVHTVKQGETLADIASLYNVTVEDIKKMNESAEVVFPGLVLNIPKRNEPQPKQVEQKEEAILDKVKMIDGSYIMCKVVNIRKTTIIIKQKEIEENISIPVKDIIEILYANGTKKRYGKR